MMIRREKLCYLFWKSSDLKLLEFNNSFCSLYSWIKVSSCEYLNSIDWWCTCKKFSYSVSMSYFTCHATRFTSSDVIIRSVVEFKLLNSIQIELQCWVELRRINSTRSDWVRLSTQLDQLNELTWTQWHV